MQTKNIFKTLALAMLMPTMLLTTACSSEDDVVNSNLANIETVANKGYALPVTVNVTREGDATMRAAFDGSKLNFGEGDKLFVKGNDYSEGGTGFFAGTLTWKSGGTFSGTILTEKEYTGAIDALFAKGSALATLLPADYGDYPYLSFDDEGTCSASVNYDATKTFATSKATAVEQFSFEVGGYTSGTGFALHPSNAILNFTITGLAASTEFAVAFKDNTDFTISGNVTTNVSGTATFAIGVNVGTDLKNWTLKVGTLTIPLVSSSKEVAAGKIYNITRSTLTYPIALSAVTSSYVGSVVTTDGNVYATVADATAASKTAVAKIIYVTSTGDGLALALEDEGQMDWNTAESTCSSKTPTISGTTWKLASQTEWNNMITAAGSYTALRDGFSSFGGTNMNAGTYWSSTDAGTIFSTQLKYGYKFNDGSWGSFGSTYGQNTRACLAF